MIRVCLVETTPADSKGSMRRYADLVQASLQGHALFSISRCNVATDLSPLPRKLRTPVHHWRTWRETKKLASDPSIDLFHLIDGSHGYLVNAFAGRPTVATVHDLIPKLQCLRHFSVARPGLFSRTIIDLAVSGLCAADHLVFDSQSTRDDYHTYSPGRVGAESVIPLPIENAFRLANKSHPVRSSETCRNERYVFHLGNNGFYKNRAGAIRVYAAICHRVPHRLLMAGPPPTADLVSLTKTLGISERVQFITNPTDDHVRSLYRSASALIFPSVYEGFGWPPIESMASGCPVVCSDGGALPEVVGSAACVCGADDLAGMSVALLRLLTDSPFRESMIRRGHRWSQRFSLERFAGQLEAAYGQARPAHLVQRSSVPRYSPLIRKARISGEHGINGDGRQRSPACLAQQDTAIGANR